MTALWIILGIIAFLAVAIYILLYISVCCSVDASSSGIKLSVKYFGIKLWSYDSNFPDSNKAAEDPEPDIQLSELTEEVEVDEESDTVNEDTDTSKLDGIKAKIEEYKPFIPVAKKSLQKLIKLIRFYDLELNLTVGDADAYKAAMRYGEVNALVYSLLGLLCTAFTVKIKSTNINCCFNENKFDASLKTVIKARPSAVLCLLIYLGINYLKITRKNKKKRKTSEKELNNNERTEQES